MSKVSDPYVFVSERESTYVSYTMQRAFCDGGKRDIK